MDSPEGKKKNIFKIKKRLSRFITNSHKIVQKVKPQVNILVPKKRTINKKRFQEIPQVEKLTPQDLCENTISKPLETSMPIIYVPDFNGKL